MDLKKETPEIIGQAGIDHPKHPLNLRTEIAGSLNVSSETLMPDMEKAEDILGKIETDEFLKGIAHIEEQEPSKIGQSDQASDFSNLGEQLNAFSPLGEDCVRTTSSKKFNKIREGKKAA